MFYQAFGVNLCFNRCGIFVFGVPLLLEEEEESVYYSDLLHQYKHNNNIQY